MWSCLTDSDCKGRFGVFGRWCSSEYQRSPQKHDIHHSNKNGDLKAVAVSDQWSMNNTNSFTFNTPNQ